MKNGNLVGFFGGSWRGIGVYGGENGFWTLLNRRKTPKKRPIMRTFIQLLTIFLQKGAAFDTLLTTFLHKNCSVNNS
jgi:hypothetical protein